MDPKVLYNISYGMYIVSSFKNNLLNGQIANTIFQITNEPIVIAVSINKKNLTHEYIEDSQKFSVSILAEDTPLQFIGDFGFKSGRDGNKFQNIKYKLLSSGCPVVLENATSYLEAKVINKIDCFTHTVFLGEISDSEILKAGNVMTYKYYHDVKRGTTPKTAPTFVKEEPKQTIKAQKYKCTVCGYIYDPELGDPDGKIPVGTLFENIPDTWVCPVCGATKDQFIKEE